MEMRSESGGAAGVGSLAQHDVLRFAYSSPSSSRIFSIAAFASTRGNTRRDLSELLAGGQMAPVQSVSIRTDSSGSAMPSCAQIFGADCGSTGDSSAVDDTQRFRRRVECLIEIGLGLGCRASFQGARSTMNLSSLRDQSPDRFQAAREFQLLESRDCARDGLPGCLRDVRSPFLNGIAPPRY